jgi:hypothetical protein
MASTARTRQTASHEEKKVCHPERSEGSAFYEVEPQSIAKEIKITGPSSGHGFSRAERTTKARGFSR